MATNLFEAASQNPAIKSQVSAAVEQAAGSSVETPEQAQALVERAASDPAFKSSLETNLQSVASANGLSPNLAGVITAGSYAAGMGFALGSTLKFKAHKDNPDELKLAAAAAVFTK